MFDTKTLTGGPITREYAERRMANLFLIAPRTDPYVRVYAYGSYQGCRAAKRAMGSGCTCNLLPANNVCQLNGTDRRTVIHGCLSLVLIFDVCDSDDVPRRFSIVILVIDAHAYEGSVVWLPFQVPQLHMTLLVFSWIARSPPDIARLYCYYRTRSNNDETSSTMTSPVQQQNLAGLPERPTRRR